jgi:hypothetical protein
MSSRFMAAAAAVTAATAVLVPAAALADPYTADPSRLIATDQAVELQPNTTREIVVAIQGLGQDRNVLVPCFGFEVTGPGVDLAGANLEFFGTASPADPNLPDGGIPGAQRQADDSFAVPESAAVLTCEVLRMGANCRAVDSNFYDADGRQSSTPTATRSRRPRPRARGRPRQRPNASATRRASA